MLSRKPLSSLVVIKVNVIDNKLNNISYLPEQKMGIFRYKLYL